MKIHVCTLRCEKFLSLCDNIYTKIRKCYVLRRIGVSTLLIPLHSSPEAVCSLDEIGCVFWALVKKYGVRKGVAKISSEYNISQTKAAHDLYVFLRSLEKILAKSHKSTEIKLDKAVFEGIPVKGSFEVTGNCNLRCIHCYAVGERGKPFLSFKDIKKIVDQLVKSGCLFMQLTGGECTAHPEFTKIYTYFRTKGIIPTISTNGTLLKPSILRVLKKYPPYYVRLSLYGGSAKVHDSITQVSGFFERTTQAALALKKAGIHVSFNSTIFKETFCDVKNIKTFCNNLHIPVMFYGSLIPRLTADTSALFHALSPSDCESLKRTNLIQKKSKQQAPWFKPDYVPTNHNDGIYFNCNAGSSSFHINCMGELSICKMERSLMIPLRDNDFDTAWQKLRALRNNLLLLSPSCRSCAKNVSCKVCPVKVSLAARSKVPAWFCV